MQSSRFGRLSWHKQLGSHLSAYKFELSIIRLRSESLISKMRSWSGRSAPLYMHLSFRGKSIRKAGSAHNTNQCDKKSPQNLEEEVKVFSTKSVKTKSVWCHGRAKAGLLPNFVSRPRGLNLTSILNKSAQPKGEDREVVHGLP